jgi:hypothetical protein
MVDQEQAGQQKRKRERVVRGREPGPPEDEEILSILYTNAQSLQSKIVDLEATTELLSPDIILLTETWTHKNVTNASMTIQGYRLEERSDREDTTNGIGGGLAIYVKEKYITLPYTKSHNFNQYAGLKIKSKGTPLNIVLVYRPPSSGNENTAELCNLLSSLDKNTFVIGDYNLPGINWEDGSSDSKGRPVLETAAEHGLHQMVDFATHIKGNRLDLILTNCPEKVLDVSDEGRLGRSDHVIMLLKIAKSVEVKNSKKEIICWKKGRYENINRNLYLIDWEGELSNMNTEESWNKFKNILSEQVKDEVPSFTPSGKNRPQWLVPEIRALLTAKKKAWKKMKEDKSTKSRLEYEEAAKKVKKKNNQREKETGERFGNGGQG